jgi:protein-tyrosine phosphatase
MSGWTTPRHQRYGGSEKKIGMVDCQADRGETEGRTVKTVLFLCTGNYYRSRFAEELFNHHAQRAGLDWIAQSRGLALERGAHNVGPISRFALHALKELAITARGADRFPQQCTVDDFASADFVVAVKEAEHRPLMRKRFAKWEHVPDYWNVHDVEHTAPTEALKLLAQEVQMLLLRFGNGAV